MAGVFSRQQTKAAPAPKQSTPSNEPPMDFDSDVPFNLDLNDGAIRGPFYSRGYYESTA